MNWQSVVDAIGESTGKQLRLSGSPLPVAGGCINDSRVLKLENQCDGAGEKFFVKINAASFLDQFEAEAAGLEELAVADAIRVPTVITMGIVQSEAFLALSHIPMGRGRANSARDLGAQLAMMHRTLSKNGKFGWSRDNAIGATPQVNSWTSGWCEFFCEHRLKFQFDLARAKGRVFPNEAAFLDGAVPAILDGHEPTPSLLHGDLWGGNVSYDTEGSPVIFDPAVYFGDRETDMAFTYMFGGFDREFYQAYEAAWPLAPEFERRRELYNLYHLLNHFNLFGGSYAAQAEASMRALLGSM